jgi:hypothetical protein
MMFVKNTLVASIYFVVNLIETTNYYIFHEYSGKEKEHEKSNSRMRKNIRKSFISKK